MRVKPLAPDPIDAIAPVRDERFTFHGYHQAGAVCRVRCYEPPGLPPVIICSELPENRNTSITNLAEYLAPEVIRTFYPERLDDPEGVVWLEHYPAERGIYPGKPTYDRVTFQHGAPRIRRFSGRERVTLGSPSWRRLSAGAVLALLAAERGNENDERTAR